MVNRGDISARIRKKSLHKLVEDKKENPGKYTHDTSEKSLYLALDWDRKHGNLNPGKLEQYNELKKKYGG